MDIMDLSDLNISQKEQKILEAAIKVFSEKGFSAATTSEIVKNAGVAEGTIFRYFKTKKDILRGILIQTINILSGKFIMESIEKILLNSDVKDLRTVLRDVIIDRVKLVDSIFPMARVILTEALLHEDVREAIYQTVITRAISAFKVFHQRMVDRGLMRGDLPIEVIARCIIGNMVALILQRKLFGDKLPVNDLDTELENIIDVVMNGIKA